MNTSAPDPSPWKLSELRAPVSTKKLSKRGRFNESNGLYPVKNAPKNHGQKITHRKK